MNEIESAKLFHELGKKGRVNKKVLVELIQSFRKPENNIENKITIMLDKLETIENRLNNLPVQKIIENNTTIIERNSIIRRNPFHFGEPYRPAPIRWQ